VGTRGTGYEKGLDAVIRAVSPELTGGQPGSPDANPEAPNHGFIRGGDTGIAVIFVSDENDCSHDGSIPEMGGMCGAEACDYWASPQLQGPDNPLLSPAQFKTDFMAGLEATKGAKVEESQVLMAAIVGLWGPYEGTFPTSCSGADKPAVPEVCSDPNLGVSTSGDRYQQAVRQFLNYFPNDASSGDQFNFEKKDFGWMCAGDFSPALTAIGEFIGASQAACIQEQIFPCVEDADCPNVAFGGPAGRCIPFGDPTKTDAKFCDSGVMITIERDPTQNATIDDIANQTFCADGTIGVLPGRGREKNTRACVVDPAKYQWIPCPAGSGVQLQWNDPEPVVASALAGYNINQIFNVATPTGN
jgi:hypothetical protein